MTNYNTRINSKKTNVTIKSYVFHFGHPQQAQHVQQVENETPTFF